MKDKETQETCLISTHDRWRRKAPEVHVVMHAGGRHCQPAEQTWSCQQRRISICGKGKTLHSKPRKKGSSFHATLCVDHVRQRFEAAQHFRACWQSTILACKAGFSRLATRAQLCTLSKGRCCKTWKHAGHDQLYQKVVIPAWRGLISLSLIKSVHQYWLFLALFSFDLVYEQVTFFWVALA